MKNRSIVITFLLSIIFVSSCFFGILFYYDPLKIFHKPWKYKEYLQGNMRQQAAGILDNWEYDSLILGTSMLENTSSKEASKKLGGKFINISLSGSDFFERAIVLNYALKKKEIKKVLYSLDSFAFIGLRKGRKKGGSAISNWDYLYDENSFNNFKAYLNDRYLKCLFSTKRKCMGRKTDFDRPNAWYKSRSHAVRFGGLDNWFKAKNNKQVKGAFKSILGTLKHIKEGKTKIDKNLNANILKSQQYLDETLIKFAKEYKNTEFILFLPPYSRIRYAIDAQYNISSFERYKKSVKYLVQKSKEYPNIKIYGWGNHTFLDDIANYKDLSHYEYKINSWMLSAIQKDEGLLTVKNIDEYLNIFTKKALNYNLIEIGEKIDNYLHPKK